MNDKILGTEEPLFEPLLLLQFRATQRKRRSSDPLKYNCPLRFTFTLLSSADNPLRFPVKNLICCKEDRNSKIGCKCYLLFSSILQLPAFFIFLIISWVGRAQICEYVQQLPWNLNHKQNLFVFISYYFSLASLYSVNLKLISMETASETARKNPKVNGENSENSNITLPEEIVTDIISRLPVKQVFQLQCLSKNFSSITNDLNFIDAHLGRSARRCSSIILDKGNDIYLIHSNGIDSETTVEEVPLHRIIDLTNSAEKLRIEASCNGLVIFSVGDRDCFIWNPATTQCNRLPTPGNVDGMCHLTAEWGFGYCTKSRQYKIVRIAYYYEGSIWGDGEMVVEVLSYGADCKWRRLDYSKFDAMCDVPGITVKGVVYWTLINDVRLLSFDMEEEEFAWVVCPFGACSKIMEFRGSLAACKPSGISQNAYDIYVLKKAANVDSWEIICTAGDIFPSLPIIFLNDHQLFLVDKSKYDEFDRYEEDKVEFSCSLYDLEREEIKEIPHALASNSSDALNFVESMVPLLP